MVKNGYLTQQRSLRAQGWYAGGVIAARIRQKSAGSRRATLLRDTAISGPGTFDDDQVLRVPARLSAVRARTGHPPDRGIRFAHDRWRREMNSNSCWKP